MQAWLDIEQIAVAALCDEVRLLANREAEIDHPRDMIGQG